MKLTELETQMLENICSHEMNEVNGATEWIEDADMTVTYYWAEDFAKGIGSVNQVKGVVTSLVKKGLVVVQEDSMEDSMIWLTDEGLQAWKS